LQNVPVYNFGKRRRLHGDIETLEKQLRDIIEEVKHNYSSSNEQKIDSLRSQVEIIDNNLQESRTFINRISGSLTKEKKQMEVYESPKMEVIAFDSEDVIITSCSPVTCDGYDNQVGG
jgi:predicted RNase H-like nuclease (RuvC/YqgF family)